MSAGIHQKIPREEVESRQQGTANQLRLLLANTALHFLTGLAHAALLLYSCSPTRIVAPFNDLLQMIICV